jgi:hypothetical protein
MSHRIPIRFLTAPLALAFLLHAAVRPLAMSASLQAGTAAHHAMAGGMPHQMAAPADAAGAHTEHTPVQHRHCADDCCGLCVSAFTMSGATATISVDAAVTAVVAALFSQSAPLGVLRHRQPLPIGPPASRA